MGIGEPAVNHPASQSVNQCIHRLSCGHLQKPYPVHPGPARVSGTVLENIR